MFLNSYTDILKMKNEFLENPCVEIFSFLNTIEIACISLNCFLRHVLIALFYGHSLVYLKVYNIPIEKKNHKDMAFCSYDEIVVVVRSFHINEGSVDDKCPINQSGL